MRLAKRVFDQLCACVLSHGISAVETDRIKSSQRHNNAHCSALLHRSVSGLTHAENNPEQAVHFFAV